MLGNEAKNSMLDHVATEILYMSLHSAYPATSGNEIIGGTPAYARKAITWGAATNGSIPITNQPVFDVPACTVVAIGLCSAVTAGTIYSDYQPVNTEMFAAQGNYTVTSCTIDLNK